MLDIAIIGSLNEPEVVRLVNCLEALGRSPLIIDSFALPQQHELTFMDGSWRYDGHELSAVKAFFVHSLYCTEVAADSAEELGYHINALQEKDSFLSSLLRWAAMRKRLVINPVDAVSCCYYRLGTLSLLTDAGVPVPATLGTNNAGIIASFTKSHSQLVFKHLTGNARSVPIDADDLSAPFLERLQSTLIMLQERIEGDTIRAYVLGNEVLAAAKIIANPLHSRTGQPDFQPTTLSGAEAADVIRAARLMSLSFAGIDVKRTPGGGHFLLDVNPAPAFASFEKSTGLEIASRIAQHLIEATLNRAVALP